MGFVNINHTDSSKADKQTITGGFAAGRNAEVATVEGTPLKYFYIGQWKGGEKISYVSGNPQALYDGSDIGEAVNSAAQVFNVFDLGQDMNISSLTLYVSDSGVNTTNMVKLSNELPENADSHNNLGKTILRTNGIVQNSIPIIENKLTSDGYIKVGYTDGRYIGKYRYIMVYDWSNMCTASEIYAETDTAETPIPAIQLGEGKNENPYTFQVYDYQLLDENGEIPSERLPSEINKLEDTKADKRNAVGGFVGGGNASTNAGGAIGYSANTQNGGAVGANTESINGFAGGKQATTEYGGSIGEKAESHYGGAVGSLAKTNAGGSVGENAESDYGGAVGKDAYTTSGGAVGRESSSGVGGTVGYKTIATNGGAVGNQAQTDTGGSLGDHTISGYGGAVGFYAKATNGGAIGENAITSSGFAGGRYAKTVNSDKLDSDGNPTPIDAVQLGEGTNPNEKTLQIYDYQLLDADGKIPSERLPENPMQNYSTTPQRVGTWIDGTPIWRMAFEAVFGNSTEVYAPLPIQTKSNALILGMVTVFQDRGTPNMCDDMIVYGYNNELVDYTDLECTIRFNSDSHYGVTGYIEFVTPESNIEAT